MERFYRPDEVAKALNVDVRIVLREIRAKGLNCVVLGARIKRIPQSTFDTLKKNGVQYYHDRKNR